VGPLNRGVFGQHITLADEIFPQWTAGLPKKQS